jgi:NtrC-family two-component system response regulator AlgB
VTVNCPALTGDLVTGALFGQRKDSFAGPVANTTGKVEEADGGTLLLDQVGELTADAQLRVLRFLNERTYERLGEATKRHADVRVIATTNRDLEAEVRAGRFREDLFYRLNVVTLTLPALRERPEDIPLLARHYLAIAGRKQGRPMLSFTVEAEQALVVHRWPGNLRELRNAIERAVILASSDVLNVADLGRLPPSAAAGGQAMQTTCVGAPISLDTLEREHVARVVAQSPSLEAAARVLGIDATTLQRKRKRYGLM